MASENEIRTLAFELWKNDTTPKKDQDHYWYKAEAKLNEPTPPTPPTPVDPPTPPTPVDPVPVEPVSPVSDNSIDNLLGR